MQHKKLVIIINAEVYLLLQIFVETMKHLFQDSLINIKFKRAAFIINANLL